MYTFLNMIHQFSINSRILIENPLTLPLGKHSSGHWVSIMLDHKIPLDQNAYNYLNSHIQFRSWPIWFKLKVWVCLSHLGKKHSSDLNSLILFKFSLHGNRVMRWPPTNPNISLYLDSSCKSKKNDVKKLKMELKQRSYIWSNFLHRGQQSIDWL